MKRSLSDGHSCLNFRSLIWLKNPHKFSFWSIKLSMICFLSVGLVLVSGARAASVVRTDGIVSLQGLEAVSKHTEDWISPDTAPDQRLTLQEINILDKILSRDEKGRRDAEEEIDAWNLHVYEKLQSQLVSDERRARVVIMSYETFWSEVDVEHEKAAKTWTALGISVLFYRKQSGDFDIGDVIERVSDLARHKAAQVDVLLEDHATYMEEAFMQPHFMDVLWKVYRTNKLFRFAVLTCRGKETLDDLQQFANTVEPQKYKPIYENLNAFGAGPDFQTLIFPTESGIKVSDGHNGKGIYSQANGEREKDIERRLNLFFNFEAFDDFEEDEDDLRT